MVRYETRPDPENWNRLQDFDRRQVYGLAKRLYGIARNSEYPWIDNLDEDIYLHMTARDYRMAKGWFWWTDIVVTIEEDVTEVYTTDAETEDYDA